MFHLFCNSSFGGFTEHSMDKCGWGECFLVFFCSFLFHYVLFCLISVTTVSGPRYRMRMVRAMVMEALNAESHRTVIFQG